MSTENVSEGMLDPSPQASVSDDSKSHRQFGPSLFVSLKPIPHHVSWVLTNAINELNCRFHVPEPYARQGHEFTASSQSDEVPELFLEAIVDVLFKLLEDDLHRFTGLTLFQGRT